MCWVALGSSLWVQGEPVVSGSGKWRFLKFSPQAQRLSQDA